MKTRFILFCIVGVLVGACAGIMTAVVGLQPTGEIQGNPQLTQMYVNGLVKSASIWAGVGFLIGALLFLFSLGETPVMTDTVGRPLGGRGLENFDYRRVGNKVLYMCIAITLANAFWLIPFLSEPGVTHVRSMAIRLIGSIVISLTALIGTFMIVMTIVTVRARR